MAIMQSSTSLEYVRVPVSATVNGVTIDPTADAVAFAFVPADTNPLNTDYVAGTWETAVTGQTTTRYARCLVGPGGTKTLSVGTYAIWVRVTDSPEIPARLVDWLTIE